ncbi:MAG: hypothetical protein GXO61_04420 [Epsilonproteobacteria bacterium]|nr:hypothetical protein [Campylobacterota bacterium]
MERKKEVLKEFIRLLEEENSYIIKSLQEKEASAKLLEIVQKKEELLQEILSWEKEEVKPFLEELRVIDELSQRNYALALNNIEFINEIFDAIYTKDTPTQYTKDGNLSSKKEGLFNKKV